MIWRICLNEQKRDCEGVFQFNEKLKVENEKLFLKSHFFGFLLQYDFPHIEPIFRKYYAAY